MSQLLQGPELAEISQSREVSQGCNLTGSTTDPINQNVVVGFTDHRDDFCKAKPARLPGMSGRKVSPLCLIQSAVVTQISNELNEIICVPPPSLVIWSVGV